MPGDGEQKGAVNKRDKSENGALEMLLKSHYEPMPPEGYFETLWPSVEDKMKAEDGAGSADKGRDESDEGGEIFFRSSPALEALKIPDRPSRRRTTGALPVIDDSPAPQGRGSYGWPAAFVMASAIAVGGFLIYKKMSPPGPPARGPEPTLSAQPRPVAAAPVAPSADATLVAAATSVDAGSPGAGGDEPRADEKKAPTKGTARRPRRKTAAKTRPGAEPPKPVARVAKTPAGKKKKGGDALDSLIDNAIGKEAQIKTKPKAAAAAPAKPVGKTELTKTDIRAGMKKVNSQVQTCYDKYQIEGTAWVKLTITPLGMPTGIRIKGKFLGTDTGNCVIKAVKRARFAKFSGKPKTVNYPFRLAE